MKGRLDQFLTELPVQSLAHQAAEITGGDATVIAQVLETFRNEAHATFELAVPHL